MAVRRRVKEKRRLLPGAVHTGLRRIVLGTYGLVIVAAACAAWGSLVTWSVHDPSLNNATRIAPKNLLGSWGAVVADLSFQSIGLASIILFLPLGAWGWHLLFGENTRPPQDAAVGVACLGPGPRGSPCSLAAAEELAVAKRAGRHPRRLHHGGGACHRPVPAGGRGRLRRRSPHSSFSAPCCFCSLAARARRRLWRCGRQEPRSAANGPMLRSGRRCILPCTPMRDSNGSFGRSRDADDARDDVVEDWAEPDSNGRIEPSFGAGQLSDDEDFDEDEGVDEDEDGDVTEPNYRITRSKGGEKPRHRTLEDAPRPRCLTRRPRSNCCSQRAPSRKGRGISDEVLQENARELEGVLQDFGINRRRREQH